VGERGVVLLELLNQSDESGVGLVNQLLVGLGPVLVEDVGRACRGDEELERAVGATREPELEEVGSAEFLHQVCLLVVTESEVVADELGDILDELLAEDDGFDGLHDALLEVLGRLFLPAESNYTHTLERMQHLNQIF
jgi:hypothetical protein